MMRITILLAFTCAVAQSEMGHVEALKLTMNASLATSAVSRPDDARVDEGPGLALLAAVMDDAAEPEGQYAKGEAPRTISERARADAAITRSDDFIQVKTRRWDSNRIKFLLVCGVIILICLAILGAIIGAFVWWILTFAAEGAGYATGANN